MLRVIKYWPLTADDFRHTARQLSEHSGDLASSYRPLAEFERARRTHYRQTHAGKLPWEVRGLAGSTNERVPEMALEVQGQEEGLPEIGADALDRQSKVTESALMRMNADFLIRRIIRGARQARRVYGLALKTRRSRSASPAVGEGSDSRN